MKKSGRQLDAEIAEALVKRPTGVGSDVVDAFTRMADDAETDGAENLFLARRSEGYTGDPKEFRFSEIFARRIPTYKYERFVDYIEQYSKHPYERLGRKLSAKEADWMLRQASKLRDDEHRALRRALGEVS